MERQHKCTELRGHNTDHSVTNSWDTRDTGIRSQKKTVVFDNSFVLNPAAKKEALACRRCAAKHAR